MPSLMDLGVIHHCSTQDENPAEPKAMTESGTVVSIGPFDKFFLLYLGMEQIRSEASRQRSKLPIWLSLTAYPCTTRWCVVFSRWINVDSGDTRWLSDRGVLGASPGDCKGIRTNNDDSSNSNFDIVSDDGDTPPLRARINCHPAAGTPTFRRPRRCETTCRESTEWRSYYRLSDFSFVFLYFACNFFSQYTYSIIPFHSIPLRPSNVVIWLTSDEQCWICLFN